MGPCADEPERDSGFAVYAAGQRANNWRYQLAEVAGGTAVTESFELGGHPALKLYGLVLGPLAAAYEHPRDAADARARPRRRRSRRLSVALLERPVAQRGLIAGSSRRCC